MRELIRNLWNLKITFHRYTPSGRWYWIPLRLVQVHLALDSLLMADSMLVGVMATLMAKQVPWQIRARSGGTWILANNGLKRPMAGVAAGFKDMKRFLLFTAIILLSVVNGFSPTVQVTSGGSVTEPAKLAIGISSISVPDTSLEVAETGTGTPRGILSGQHNTGTDGARVGLRKARGTRAAPTTIVTGDELGGIHVWGYDSANYLDMAGIDFVSTGTIAATRVPTEMRFYTATDALPSVKTLRGTFTKAGDLTLTASLLSGIDVYAAAGGIFQCLGRGVWKSPSDGVWTALNNAQTDFNRLQLGGTTASFPAIKRNGASIDFRLADDSAYANINAAVINASTALIISGIIRQPPGALQTLSAGTAITVTAPTVRIVGNAAPIVSTATPIIADAVSDGTVVRIFGTAAVNTVTLTDETGLPGSNLELNAATRVMGLGSILVLYYDATTTKWFEQSYSDNP